MATLLDEPGSALALGEPELQLPEASAARAAIGWDSSSPEAACAGTQLHKKGALGLQQGSASLSV